MCIATIACNHTAQNQFTAVGNGRFAFITGFSEPMVMNVTPVLAEQTGVITSVNKQHGYIDFTLPTAAYEKTLTKNGAPTLPINNGKLFFHESQLSMPITSASIGMHVSFDVCHVKSSNKLIAYSVTKLTDARAHELTNQAAALASFLNMKPATPAVTLLGKGKIGTIEKLGRGFGYIKYVTEKIPFHESKLSGCVLSELKANTVVEFCLMRNNKTGKTYADRVEFIEHAPAPKKMLGYFIDCSNTCSNDKLVVKEATGKICTIKNHQATTKYEDKTVTFSDKNLFDTALHLLQVGDNIKFDVYSTSSGYISKSVEKAAPSAKDMLLGHFQFTSTNLSTSNLALVQKSAVCSITRLVKEGGFVNYGTDSIYFHENELRGLHILELETGNMVTCDIWRNNNKFVAKNVNQSEIPAINVMKLPFNLQANLQQSSTTIDKQMSGKDSPAGYSSLVNSRRSSILGFGKKDMEMPRSIMTQNINRNR